MRKKGVFKENFKIGFCLDTKKFINCKNIILIKVIKVTNTEVLSRCEMPGIESFLFRHRLRWAGHLMRMDGNRLPRKKKEF